MEDRMLRAMARWPNVPALYGWLLLDRRGNWHVRGERITRPQIIDTINANYLPDAEGAWYFQNGPQRGYVCLAYAPLILMARADGSLVTHTGAQVQAPTTAWMDEDGSLLLTTEHGPALLADTEGDWLLERLISEGDSVDEAQLAQALAQPSGSPTALRLSWGKGQSLPLTRLDAAQAPASLGFIADPQPADS
ncbi:DUF2946 family protein [Algiphilus sp.]|uniref:DUF2946 family protein n=1 Tax=Algiphilus sp. TaxID=1872431 RepID=UPI002A5FA473|nr:DUF2946 family protein [Pseudomonadota bacterium]